MNPQPSREIWVAINTTWNVFNFRSGLLSALSAAGYRVVAFSPSDGYVEKVERLGARHVPMELDAGGTNPFREALTLVRIVRLLGRERPALILTYTPKVNIYVSLAARIWGIPVVANVTGLGRAFIAGGWLELVSKALYRVAFSWPVRVVFQNEEDHAMFLGEKLVQPERATIAPGSGVNVARFVPVERLEREDNFVFVMASRLLWDKGVGEFVEAARIIRRERPEVRFRLSGAPDQSNPAAIRDEVLQEWIREGVVEHFGHSDDIVEVYRNSHCVVLPSYREGLPRTLLEAASMGLPVIASDVPGCRRAVVHGETGYLCNVRSAEDLAAAMKRMLELSPAERVAMGDKARQRTVREFDENLVIRFYLDTVAEVLGRGGAESSGDGIASEEADTGRNTLGKVPVQG